MITGNLEQKIGIKVYLTSATGIEGKLRCLVEDFKVEEIPDVATGGKGNFLVIELTKHNWETHLAIKAIARSLGVSYKRIGFAGTKDRRAVTKQVISIWNIDEALLESLKLDGIQLRVLGKSERPVALGDLKGNRFDIVIRDIGLEPAVLRERAGLITQEIVLERGVPNFFGVQRFGTRRPVTGDVGDAILRGDFERAVLIYIARPGDEEQEQARTARQYVLETGDFKGGLRLFPKYLRYERAMMQELVNNPGDFRRALRVLPANLLQMFVHAFQSIMFNKILSRRIKAGLKLNQAVNGDIVCFSDEEGYPNSGDLRLVKAENLENTNNLISKGRAFVTAPVLGYETPLSDGVPGEIERSVIEELGLTGEQFKVKLMPELSSKGLRREVLLKVSPEFQISNDELNPGRQKLVLNFSLPKGSYATTVLREYMKSKDLIKSGF